MFKTRICVCSNSQFKFDNYTNKIIPARTTCQIMNLPAKNNMANPIMGLTKPRKLIKTFSHENSENESPYALLPANKKAKLLPLEHSYSLPTTKPVVIKDADVYKENIHDMSLFQVPRVSLEKMNLEKHGIYRPSSDVSLLKEESNSAIPAMQSNSDGVSAVTSWVCKNVVHTKDVLPENGDQHGLASMQQSAGNLQGDKPTTQPKGLTSQILLEAFNHLEIAMHLFKTYDSDYKRSSTVNHNLVGDYACYTEMYKEKERTSKQLSSGISKTADAATSNLKEAIGQQQSGCTFKPLPRASSDNSAATPVSSQDKRHNFLLSSPLQLNDNSCDSAEDDIFQDLPKTTFDLGVSPQLPKAHSMPKSKSTSESNRRYSKTRLLATHKTATGPSHGKTKTVKDCGAKLGGSFDAEELAAQNPIIVYFDLETTGLGYSHEIVQVSCVCSRLEEENSANFNVYALPLGHFDPMASFVTNLKKQNNSLYLHGTKVPSVSLAKCLTQFVSWLQSLPRPALLVGHNSKTFDAPRLVLALWNCNLLSTFQNIVWGFADSLPWAKAMDPNQCSYRLEELSATFCPLDMPIAAHNALDDCRALEVVVHALAQIQPQCTASVRQAASCDVAAGKRKGAAKTCGVTNDVEQARQSPNKSGLNNGSSCRSNVNETQQDNACAQIDTSIKENSPAVTSLTLSMRCPGKTHLLKSLQPFAFSTQSVMVGLNKSRPGKACLSATGS